MESKQRPTYKFGREPPFVCVKCGERDSPLKLINGQHTCMSCSTAYEIVHDPDREQIERALEYDETEHDYRTLRNERNLAVARYNNKMTIVFARQ